VKHDRGGTWVLAQTLLLAAALGSGMAWNGQWHSPALGRAGQALLVLAAICGIAGARALGRGLTPFPRPAPGMRLVQHGIYALMRHPLYTAVMCGTFGWALLRASWPALGLALGLAIFFDAKARTEERWLREQFPEYGDYERRVSRFVPGVY
jgi:protein-S-isoprenylcysteine O-methyltransferase Ste14